MAIYFISDLHLDLSRPVMAAGFLNFLKDLKDADKLYILGDFFEAWIGDDAQTPLSQQVEAGLKALSASGCEVFVMHGNRDFLLGQEFCERSGASLIEEGSILELGDSKLLVLHGDSLCTDDKDYQQFRQMSRSPQWQQQFLSLTIEQRIAMAKEARAASKESMSNKSDDIMDVNQQAVDQAMTEAGVTQMLHGHTHRPKQHEWALNDEQRTRTVLGDWSDTQGWLVRWTEEKGLELEAFELRAA